MINLKQLLCRHDWLRTADRMHREGHYIRMRKVYKCRKCGKVEYR